MQAGGFALVSYDGACTCLLMSLVIHVEHVVSGLPA
jgi:hypothetical protein